MSNKRAKIFGILIIFAAFLVASIGSLMVTSPSVLDTNAETYVIVVMLMLFVFIIFSAKSDVEFEYRRKNILYAVILLALYLFLLSYLRVSLSTAFLSYRIDALLFPLLLLCFVVLVFGFSGARKMWSLIAYAFFASPLLLIPVLNLNNAFANVNANLVYNIVKATGAPATREGLVIFSRLGANITISGTCVALGTFVAFVMFLIPLAYLYEGTLRRKLYWVVSGTALMLALNTARMLLIALVWVYYGLGNAVTTFHIFAGQLIFYISIIAMVLIAGKYGLGIRKAKKGSAADLRNFYAVKDKRIFKIAALALGFGVIVLVFNLGYTKAIQAPSILFSHNNVSRIILTRTILNSISNSGSNITVLNASNTVDMFLLAGVHADLNRSAYAVTSISYSAVPSVVLPGYTPLGGVSKYNLESGVTISTQKAQSGKSTFEVNYFSIPYSINGSWIMVNYVIFERINGSSVPMCQSVSQSGSVNWFESYIYNLAANGGGSGGLMCQSYRIASSA